jgi:hypothetical protein
MTRMRTGRLSIALDACRVRDEPGSRFGRRRAVRVPPPATSIACGRKVAPSFRRPSAQDDLRSRPASACSIGSRALTRFRPLRSASAKGGWRWTAPLLRSRARQSDRANDGVACKQGIKGSAARHRSDGLQAVEFQSSPCLPRLSAWQQPK